MFQNTFSGFLTNLLDGFEKLMQARHELAKGVVEAVKKMFETLQQQSEKRSEASANALRTAMEQLNEIIAKIMSMQDSTYQGHQWTSH